MGRGAAVVGGADDDERSRFEERRASFDETIGGMWSGAQLFDPISGLIVSNELRRLERQLFEADWAEAKERLRRGRPHLLPPLCDAVARDCQVDHIVPYAAGGLTSQDNGRLACGHHNRLRHGKQPPPPADDDPDD